MAYLPLFVTNLARSGSYLISMMMSQNRDVMVASEPYLEVFRSLRNALVREDAPAGFNPSAPLQDYYFTDERIHLLDLVQNGDLGVRFDPAEWDTFLTRNIPRVGLQCAELIPLLPKLRGATTYKELFDRAFDIIIEARGAAARKWVGIKDAWTIEFFRPLAKAYPTAKFVTILRDPRATVNSMLGVVAEDPSQVAHVLSYARHWRKAVAFVNSYLEDPLFAGRFLVVTHESVVRAPEAKAREICRFLDVEYDPAMIDTEKFHDYATGGVWKGNSSFEANTQGISVHRAERWKTKLDRRIVKLIDFVCGPDMPLLGYAPVEEVSGADPEVLAYLIESAGEYVNWRSDLGDLERDYGFELFRRALLDLPEGVAVDPAVLRRSFLFEEVYAKLRKKKALATAA